MAKKAEAQNPLDYLKKIQFDDKGTETSWYRNSKAAIRSFLNTVFNVSQKPTTGLKAPAIKAQQEADDRMYEKLASDYLAEDRDCKDDLIAWRKKSGKSARTMQMYLSPVKIFLEKNGKTLSAEDVKELYKQFKKGKEAPTDAIEKHEIRSFLQHCDVRIKAITLLLASSGMRIGECLALTDKMIEKKRKMVTLPPEVTKTDAGRVVFYNEEAADALQEWMQDRNGYINRNNKLVANIESAKPVSVKDPRIFPYDVEPINRAWNKTCKKAGMDSKNSRGFMNFHPHGLRKFYSTQMRLAGCPDGIVECLLGHIPYMGMYHNYTPKQFQEQYVKYGMVLEIGDAEEIAQTIKSITEKAIETNGKVSALEQERDELKKKVAVLEQKQKDEEYAQSQLATIPKEKLDMILKLLEK